MDSLPSELILYILSFLEPEQLAQLHGISRRLYQLSKDNELWRNFCFEYSTSEAVRRRTGVSVFQLNLPFQAHPQVQAFRRRTELALSAQQAWVDANATGSADAGSTREEVREPQPAQVPDQLNDVNVGLRERTRRLVNWDPSYRNEQVDWYTEYIARHGPLSCSWFQPPVTSNDGSTVEARGLALFGTDYVIAPLEDDSLAIWSSNNDDSHLQGRLVHKSEPGLLRSDKKTITPTIASAVTVDNRDGKAYVAVQDCLQEVDLETNQISNSQSFPTKIAALSDFTSGLPLTVGTRSAVHLYDPREKLRQGTPAEEHIDPMSTYPEILSNGNNFALLTSGNMDRFASLHQAGPTAIQHLFTDDSASTSNDIVVSGRFPSLLVYDRRIFPKVKTTLYSGAQLCGLAALPYAYSSVDSEIMRRGELPISAAQEAKSRPGHTLIACGEYKGRGSVEIYGLSDEDGGQVQTSTFKNRVSAARAKILSIANHGTGLIISDAEGGIRWLERDGQTLIRRWNVNHFEWHEDRMVSMTGGPSDGEAVLKLLPVPRNQSSKAYQDGVYVWTGERVGLLNFSSRPRFGGDSGADWEEILENAEDVIKRREEKIYGETMKRALERQADEVRWMSGLGLSE